MFIEMALWNYYEKITLQAVLVSANLLQATMVVEWSVLKDTCTYPQNDNCTATNIFFVTWAFMYSVLKNMLYYIFILSEIYLHQTQDKIMDHTITTYP